MISNNHSALLYQVFHLGTPIMHIRFLLVIMPVIMNMRTSPFVFLSLCAHTLVIALSCNTD